MKIWLITSIRLDRARAPRASTIQNLRTATALAEQGHRVLIWTAGPLGDAASWFRKWFDRPPPTNLVWLNYHPRGTRFEKKTPFFTLSQRLRARLVPRLRGAWPPEVVITRSPTVAAQLRQHSIVPAATRIILEWQYPEWMQLWRGWRRRNESAPLRDAVAQLRRWHQRELGVLNQLDGVLYAALDHQRLLSAAGYAKSSAWLPSGCLPPDPHPATPACEFDFGYVGTLAPENGIESLLLALRALPSARLMILGAGERDYQTSLERQAQSLGLAQRVTWLKPVPPGMVRDHMRRCRVGLVPLSRRAGPEKRQFASPLKLIEWLAAGVPVVAGAVPSVTGRVADQREVLLVPPDDADALCAAMQRLLHDAPLRQRLVAAGLQLATASTFASRARRITDFAAALPDPR
jgi:glycosyltransferase involved in cell wall biosynthesis